MSKNTDNLYVHYGSDKFILGKSKELRNRTGVCKPFGGLWSSPVYGTNNTWRRFCKDEHFNVESLNKSFRFRLKDDSKILKINSITDVSNMYKRFPRVLSSGEKIMAQFLDCGPFERFGISEGSLVDYERMSRVYDGIEIRDINKDDDDLSYWMRHNGWDVDTLLVFNPNIIQCEKATVSCY